MHVSKISQTLCQDHYKQIEACSSMHACLPVVITKLVVSQAKDNISDLMYSDMAEKLGSKGTLLTRSAMQLVMPSKVGASMMICPPWHASDRACTLSRTLPPYSFRLLISLTCTKQCC